jgi:hypothetical protein
LTAQILAVALLVCALSVAVGCEAASPLGLDAAGSDANAGPSSDATLVEEQGSVDAKTAQDATTGPGAIDGLDGAIPPNWPPDGGIFLDGACLYDAFFSPDGGSVASDAGSDVHAPLSHRAAAECCPLDRPAGGTCDPDAAVYPTQCLNDRNCTAGVNGRCLILPEFLGAPGLGAPPDAGTQLHLRCNGACTYDECFSDQDCPGHVPCDCRTYGYGNNLCRIGSTCAVDADCGPGGYCSWTGEVYACHRPGDTCFNARDCAQSLFGTSCLYQAASGQWACVANPPPPM